MRDKSLQSVLQIDPEKVLKREILGKSYSHVIVYPPAGGELGSREMQNQDLRHELGKERRLDDAVTILAAMLADSTIAAIR
jgi:hypothetical protein